MNCARNYKNSLNLDIVMPKILVVPFFLCIICVLVCCSASCSPAVGLAFPTSLREPTGGLSYRGMCQLAGMLQWGI